MPALSLLMRIAPFVILAALSGCVAQTPRPASSAPPLPQPAAASCPIIESGDWQAWVNAMPGPSASPSLIVTGKAVVPSGGYVMNWGQPIVMESYPVQVSVELRPSRSPGLHSQALVTREVRGEWQMRDPVGALTITCGGKTLARISPVATAH